MSRADWSRGSASSSVSSVMTLTSRPRRGYVSKQASSIRVIEHTDPRRSISNKQQPHSYKQRVEEKRITEHTPDDSDEDSDRDSTDHRRKRGSGERVIHSYREKEKEQLVIEQKSERRQETGIVKLEAGNYSILKVKPGMIYTDSGNGEVTVEQVVSDGEAGEPITISNIKIVGHGKPAIVTKGQSIEFKNCHIESVWLERMKSKCARSGSFSIHPTASVIVFRDCTVIIISDIQNDESSLIDSTVGSIITAYDSRFLGAVYTDGSGVNILKSISAGDVSFNNCDFEFILTPMAYGRIIDNYKTSAKQQMVGNTITIKSASDNISSVGPVVQIRYDAESKVAVLSRDNTVDAIGKNVDFNILSPDSVSYQSSVTSRGDIFWNNPKSGLNIISASAPTNDLITLIDDDITLHPSTRYASFSCTRPVKATLPAVTLESQPIEITNGSKHEQTVLGSRENYQCPIGAKQLYTPILSTQSWKIISF